MKNRLIVAATATAVLVGGGTAFAVAGPATDDIDSGTTVSVATTSTNPPPNPPTSEARRQQVIDRVALLRKAATASDRAPAEYVPPTNPRNGLSLTRDDLTYGRKLPGRDASWLVPLRTGGLAIIAREGGLQYAPEQLGDGTVQRTKVLSDGSGAVIGIVPDGTSDLSLATPAGTQRPVISTNVYRLTFNGRTDRPTGIGLSADEGKKTTPIAGF